MRRAAHIRMTEREFRALKRRQLRILRRAMDEFGIGCLYLPRRAYAKTLTAADCLEAIDDICRAWWHKS